MRTSNKQQKGTHTGIFWVRRPAMVPRISLVKEEVVIKMDNEQATTTEQNLIIEMATTEEATGEEDIIEMDNEQSTNKATEEANGEEDISDMDKEEATGEEDFIVDSEQQIEVEDLFESEQTEFLLESSPDAIVGLRKKKNKKNKKAY
jgi:hypothetical protein